MSKRYRFSIILVTMAICFIFLLPTLRWYYMVPKEDQTLALSSREQIKNFASQSAQADLQELIETAQSGGAISER